MAFVTKTWKDRLVEYAGRRKLKNVATGEEILMDVSRSEGTVNQAGDAFSAANMNNLEQRIKTEFDSVNSSFAYDENGIYGYRRKVDGADTVIPFKNAIKLKQFCQKSQMVINEDYDECLLVFSSAGSYGSFSIINGNNYTKQKAGDSMLTNTGVFNGQSNTECYIIKNLPKGAVISASKNNADTTIWNYSFWLFC